MPDVVVIVSDKAPWRHAIGTALSEGAYNPVIADTVLAARDLLDGGRPAIALVDFSSVSEERSSQIQSLRQDYPNLGIIALTSPRAPDDPIRALHAGADNFVNRDQPPVVLLATMQSLARRLQLLDGGRHEHA